MNKAEIRKILENNSVTFGTGEAVPEFNFNDCIDDIADSAEEEAIEFYLSMIFPDGFGGDDIADRRNFELTVRAKVKKEYQKFKDDEKTNN